MPYLPGMSVEKGEKRKIVLINKGVKKKCEKNVKKKSCEQKKSIKKNLKK